MIGGAVRPTLTTANGIESATTVRRSGWLSEQRSSGVLTPKLESGPTHGWLCHTASVVAASTLECTMSGIANSRACAVSPATVPCRHSTTSRSRPAAKRLRRRSNDGASTRRFNGWELRIAESAGVRAAWPVARPGAVSAPTISHTTTHTARRIANNSETRAVGLSRAFALALCQSVNNSSRPQAEAASGVTRGCLVAYAFRLSSSRKEHDLPWLTGDRRGSVLPTPQSLLRSVYAGRLCVAIAIYLTVALKFAVAGPLDVLVTSFVLVAAVVVTIASYWYTHLSRRVPGRTFLYGQALFDVALITTVVHITGGPQSDLTPLYVPLIAVTAVLMPPASTGLITVLVGIVYFADVFFGHTTPMTAQVGLQLLVFAAVAAVTAYFSSRVSVMGAEREALAGELRQARLEAADVLRSVPTGIVTVDQAGHLLYCNPAAEQILGFKERQWRGRPIMPEFAKIAPEFWAAITATARRGVRAMRVEATVRRPDRTFPIGVTTTTLDVEPGARDQESARVHSLVCGAAGAREARQRRRKVPDLARGARDRPAVASALGVSRFLAGARHGVPATRSADRGGRGDPARARAPGLPRGRRHRSEGRTDPDGGRRGPVAPGGVEPGAERRPGRGEGRPRRSTHRTTRRARAAWRRGHRDSRIPGRERQRPGYP